MLKKILLSLFLCICLSAIPLAGVVASGSDIIENDESGIPDKGLYQGILSALEKESNEKFTKQEAETLKDLDLINVWKEMTDIKTLKGIGYLSNLEQLSLEDHKLTNLKGIEDLHKLTHLDVSSNQLKNLKELKNLNSLKVLIVISNRLTSLKGIENLTNIDFLMLSQNKLTNLKELKKLKNLYYLDASENRLSNLKDIKSLTKLTVLNVSGNKLKTIPKIKCMNNLQSLYAAHNHLKKLPDLKSFKKLAYTRCDFTLNRLNEKELRKKLPGRFLKKGGKRKKAWLSDQFHLQNINYNIKFISPKSKHKITKDTIKIVGQVQKGAKVLLYSKKHYKPNTMFTSIIQADGSGTFVMDNLDLKKWGGDVATLLVTLDREYEYDDVILSRINFKVKK